MIKVREFLLLGHRSDSHYLTLKPRVCSLIPVIQISRHFLSFFRDKSCTVDERIWPLCHEMAVWPSCDVSLSGEIDLPAPPSAEKNAVYMPQEVVTIILFRRRRQTRLFELPA